MPFFLEQLGVRLATFDQDSTMPPEPKVDPPRPESRPFISPLGYEISNPRSEFDATSTAHRVSVLSSFDEVALLIQDTKIISDARVTMTSNNKLLMTVQSVNHLCSKLHVEDIEPEDTGRCNHEMTTCVDPHFDDESLLIEPRDYVITSPDLAVFRIIGSIVHVKVGKKWASLGLELSSLVDGCYTLKCENFI